MSCGRLWQLTWPALLIGEAWDLGNGFGFSNFVGGYWWLIAASAVIAVISFRRFKSTPSGKLTTVPYSVEYQNELKAAATLLADAAKLTTQPTLKAFLTARARAFGSNDYYESDVAWMNLDATVDPTIGPYETYGDDWFGDKAAFDNYVTLSGKRIVVTRKSTADI